MQLNRFVAVHYGARMIRDRAERDRFARLVQDRAPVEAFAEWPDFQDLVRGTPEWEGRR